MTKVLAVGIAGLLTMPVLNLSYGLVSAQSDVLMTLGLALAIAIMVVWIAIARWSYRQLAASGVAERMRKWASMFIVLVMAFSAVGCGRTLVEPGHVGIQVDYYGQDRGVESYPKVTGIVWYNPITTHVFEYPTFVQTAVWTHNTNEGNPQDESISFTTSDQMQVFADISLAYHLVPDKVPAFYVKFRSDDLKVFTHGFLRNLAREKFDTAAGRYKIEQIMGDNAPFLADVRLLLQKELDGIGVQLDQFGLIGAPRPPTQVIEAINAKVRATQIAIQVENEVRATKAQAEKNVAEAEGQARSAIARANGDAEANRLLNQSITINLIEWRRLGMQQQAIGRWDGKMPLYNGGVMPFVTLPSHDKQ